MDLYLRRVNESPEAYRVILKNVSPNQRTREYTYRSSEIGERRTMGEQGCEIEE